MSFTASLPPPLCTYALLASYGGIDIHEYGECDYYVRSFSVLSGRVGYSVNVFSPLAISTRQIRTSTVAPRRSLLRTVLLVFRVIRIQSLLGLKNGCRTLRFLLLRATKTQGVLLPHLHPLCKVITTGNAIRLYFLSSRYLWVCWLSWTYLQRNKRRAFYMCMYLALLTSSGGP